MSSSGEKFEISPTGSPWDDLDADDIRKRIMDIKSREPFSSHPLYPREWEAADSGVAAADPTRLVRVMQFNLLAEGLSSPSGSKPPIPDMAKKEPDGGNFTDLPKGPDGIVGSEILNFSTRRLRLVEEILSHSPDILTVQELDRFNDFFQPVLSKFGYDGIYSPKADSPCLKFGFYSDGVAIFWKRDKFILTSSTKDHKIEPAGRDPVDVIYAVAKLQPKTFDGPGLSVVTCHLKAKSSNEDKRMAQIHGILELVKGFDEGGHTDHIILAGDFNTDPCDTADGFKAEVIPWIAAEHPELHSCYPLDKATFDTTDDDSKWHWTTWKRRAHSTPSEIKHAIDYIYHQRDAFRTVQILKAPAEGDVLPHRLPCWRYPSDHISIVADLEVK